MRRRRYHDSEPLRLATHNKKLGGVCAGIANYFGWSSCTVRVLAIIGVILMAHVVVPAYVLAYLVLDKEDSEELYDV
jgi:phage shock protein C